jgi:hypothetical protein
MRPESGDFYGVGYRRRRAGGSAFDGAWKSGDLEQITL